MTQDMSDVTRASHGRPMHHPLRSALTGVRGWWERRHGHAPPPKDTESYAIVDGQWKLIHNTIRPQGGPEFELYDFVNDPLDKTDVAAQHPEVVARLSKALGGWKDMAVAARLKPDSEATKHLSPEQLQRLRSLGYVR